MSKPTLLALLVPALVCSGLGAAEGKTAAGPTEAYLVDSVIPAYGVIHQRPYYAESRVTGLYITIRRQLAMVEAGVMAGTSAPAAPADKASAPATAAPSDTSIQGLLAQLTAADKDIAYRTYLEQGQLDESFSNLARAAELLALRGQGTSETVTKVHDAAAAAAPKSAAVPAAPAEKPAPVPSPEKPTEKPAEAPAPAPAPEKPAEAPAPASEKPAEAPAAPEKPAEAPAAPEPEKPAEAAAPAPEKPADPAAPAAPETPADPAAAPAATEKPADAAAPADAAPAAEKPADAAAPAAAEAPPQPAQ